MIDLNTATAEQLDEIAELKGHGFEIVRYRRERGSSMHCDSSTRSRDWSENGTELRPS